MEPCVKYTIFAQLVNVGSVNLCSKAADIRETQVISYDDKKIWALGSSGHNC